MFRFGQKNSFFVGSLRVLFFSFFLFSFSAFGQTADEINKLITPYLQKSILMTLAGVKPFSSTYLTGSDFAFGTREYAEESLKQEQLFQQAIKTGILQNNDILLWPHKSDIEQDNEGSYQGYLTTWVNKKAAERLLNDRGVKEVFERNGLSVPKSVNELIRLYQAAVTNSGFHHDGPIWSNIVVGICLGFPPKEVEVYSHHLGDTELRERAKTAQAIPYKRFSDEDLERDQYYAEAYQVIEKNYQLVRSQGVSSVEIFNHPEYISSKIPAFPKKFLNKKSSGNALVCRDVMTSL
jgi:hypothetical protein